MPKQAAKRRITLRSAPQIKLQSTAQSFCRVPREAMAPLWRVFCKVDR